MDGITTTSDYRSRKQQKLTYMPITEFPDELWIANYEGLTIRKYKKIDSEIYEDLTCTHHGEKCRISVAVKSNGRFVVDELMNESAKEHQHYHKGDFFMNRADAINAVYKYQIDGINKHIAEQEDLIRLHEENASKEEKAVNFVKVDSLDYDDKVYAYRFPSALTDSQFEDRIDEFEVIEKVYNKNGLYRINAIDHKNNIQYYMFVGSDGRIYRDDYDDEGFCEPLDYLCFSDKDSVRNHYLYNESIANSKNIIKNCRRNIECAQHDIIRQTDWRNEVIQTEDWTTNGKK